MLEPEAAVGSGPPGAGGIGNGNGNGGQDNNSPNGDDNEQDPETMLAEAGLEERRVPRDMMRALRSGYIGSAELNNWSLILGNPALHWLCAIRSIRNRLLAEPRLLKILGIEIGLGLLCTFLAEKRSRGSAFLSEIDFVLANQVLIMLTNAALVFALSPAARLSAPPSGGTHLPGYFMEAGAFGIADRAACFFSKAVLFSAVGVAVSAAGHGVTMGLIKLRHRMCHDEGEEKQLAPIKDMAVSYAIFMALSSNTRYQIVNSIEGRLLSDLAPLVHTPLSVLLRSYNNYLGSANWIWFARLRGLQ